MKDIILRLKNLFASEASEFSDGYHTFNELYDHRIELWVALCRFLESETGLVWRAKLHSDGSSFEGWFVLGYRMKEGKQITYHLPLDRWEDTNFATTQNRAPEWDGHTPKDALDRITNLNLP